MDAWCDPRVAAAEQLHEELYGAFYRRAVRTEPSAPLTIDLIRLLGVLRDLKRMHASCELETVSLRERARTLRSALAASRLSSTPSCASRPLRA